MTRPIELEETAAASLTGDPGATISPLALLATAELAVTLAAPTVSGARRLPRVELAIGAIGDADLEVVGAIGQGGMGRVDLAIQHVFGRTVAVKRVRPDRLCPAAVEALVREATVTGFLDHPNIVPAHLFGQTSSGEPVLVMKRVVGVAWETLLAEPDHPAWRPQQTDRLARHLEILIDVCQAVEAAHRRGIVHCDLKPANVMVGDLGEVYVLDWGVAVRLDQERSTELAGTPLYMAPEMLRGSSAVTPATDVYLLGAVLHELLTGRPPHRAATVAQVLASVAATVPVQFAPSVPAELAAICLRALAFEPADRWPSALALRDALVEHQGHRGSLELVATGQASVLALRAAVQAGPRPGDQCAQARRHADEAEFAFRQALRSWPGNEVAARCRQEVLALRVELELADRNGAGAAALLRELVEPPPDLAGRVGALAAELEASQRAQGELAQIIRESDFGAAAMTPILSMAAGAATLAAVALALDVADVQASTRGIALYWLGATVFALVIVYRNRAKVAVNQANRATQLSYVVDVLWTLGTLVLAWALDLTPMAAIVFSMAVLGMGVAQTAVWAERSLAVYLVALPAVAGAALLWPDRPFRTFAVYGLGMVTGAGLRWYLRRGQAGAKVSASPAAG